MATLSRPVLKWLQELAISPRCTRWDFANGYLIAEIFSKFFPELVSMATFDNGTALERKLSNWALLQTVRRTCEAHVPPF